MNEVLKRHPWTQSYFHGLLNQILNEPDADKCIDLLISIWDAGYVSGEWGNQKTLLPEYNFPTDLGPRNHGNAVETGAPVFGEKPDVAAIALNPRPGDPTVLMSDEPLPDEGT